MGLLRVFDAADRRRRPARLKGSCWRSSTKPSHWHLNETLSDAQEYSVQAGGNDRQTDVTTTESQNGAGRQKQVPLE